MVLWVLTPLPRHCFKQSSPGSEETTPEHVLQLAPISLAVALLPAVSVHSSRVMFVRP